MSNEGEQEVVMSTSHIEISPDSKKAARNVGYVISVAVNVAMLVIVQNLLEWGWPAFLTDEFVEVVPWISFSLIASIVANIIYRLDESVTVKSVGQIAVNLTSVWVTYVVLTVFPFDFSGYQFDWEIVARVVLIFAIVGAGVGALVEAIKLVSTLSGPTRVDRA
jgi:hypothetical protein